MVEPTPIRHKTDAEPATAAKTDDPDDTLGAAVGRNLHRLRTRQGLSLQQLANRSGVSRAMLNQIELGRSVPTINVVFKIARAFDLPFSALLAVPDTQSARVLRACDAKVLTSPSGAFSSRALFPFDTGRKAEFYELRLRAHASEHAEAHTDGTIENLVVVHGYLDIEVESDVFKLAPGDAILFQANRPHVYRNRGDQDVLSYLVMIDGESQT